MGKKPSANILLIMLTYWIPLNKSAHADCQPCTPAQQKTCTDVWIEYKTNPQQDSTYFPNWGADMNYTPCGSNSPASSPYHAHQNSNNHCCVQSGTNIGIGQQGYQENFIHQVVTGETFHAICTGTIGLDESDEYGPTCLDANHFPAPCTTLNINYDPGVTWMASLYYTPCMATEEISDRATGLNNTYSIYSGTRVQIGRLWLSGNFIDGPMSGGQVNVQCTGKWLDEAGCSITSKSSSREKGGLKKTQESSTKPKAQEKSPPEEKVEPKTRDTSTHK